MATKYVQGHELLIELEGGKLGCLTNITLNMERAIIDASCREMGNFTGGKKGALSGSIDFDGLVIIDNPAVATNVRAQDLIDMMLDDDQASVVNYVYGPGTNNGGDVDGTMGTPGDIAGSKVLTGTAILSSFSQTGGQGENATYSGTLTFDTRPTHAAVA